MTVKEKLTTLLISNIELLGAVFLTAIAVFTLEVSWRTNRAIFLSSIMLGVAGGNMGLMLNPFLGVVFGVVSTIAGPYVIMNFMKPENRTRLITSLIAFLEKKLK